MQIVVEDLAKTFRVAERTAGTLGALRGLVRRKQLSFSVAAGELVGYIGPNGAGKSTTIKVLAGILVPDRGRVEIDGRVPWRDRIAHVRRIGVVFGQRTQLWWDLPVAESLDMLRHIYQVPAAAFAQQRAERFFTAIIPLAATTYYPARAILGRDELDLLHACGPLAGAAFLALSLGVWRIGLRRHASTGS